MTPQDIVDTERYPIHDIESEAATRLVARCRKALDDKALCYLPDFIQPQAVKRMVDETTLLAAKAPYYDEPRYVYGHDARAGDWPEGHPKTVVHANRYRQVLSHQISNDGLIRQLYLWPVLTEFIRRSLGVETLYRSQCPHLGLTLQIAGEGDTNGWHYERAIHLAPAHTTSSSQLFFVTMSRYVTGSVATACSSSR